jgi:hypothetical protein
MHARLAAMASALAGAHRHQGTRVLLYGRTRASQVRRELVALYTADCLRRLAMEVVVPLLTARARAGLVRARQRRIKADKGEAPDAADMAAVECLARDEYDCERLGGGGAPAWLVGSLRRWLRRQAFQCGARLVRGKMHQRCRRRRCVRHAAAALQ